MVFIPENGLGLDDADFKQRSKMQERFTDRSNQVILPRENQSNLFKNFINNTLLGGAQSFRSFGPRSSSGENPNAPYKVFPNYFTFTNNFSNPDLPIFNIIIENFLKVEADNSNEPFMRNISALTSSERAAQILSENSLKAIVADTSFNKNIDAILKIKSDQLFTNLEYVIGEEKLRSILNDLLEQNRFP